MKPKGKSEKKSPAGTHVVRRGDPAYPATLVERLGDDAPSSLAAIGDLGLLALPKTAFFCSRK